MSAVTFPGSAESFACWWAMVEAHQECAELPKIDDETVILHFMGSGASHMVFAKDIRAVVALIKEKG